MLSYKYICKIVVFFAVGKFATGAAGKPAAAAAAAIPGQDAFLMLLD